MLEPDRGQQLIFKINGLTSDRLATMEAQSLDRTLLSFFRDSRENLREMGALPESISAEDHERINCAVKAVVYNVSDLTKLPPVRSTFLRAVGIFALPIA